MTSDYYSITKFFKNIYFIKIHEHFFDKNSNNKKNHQIRWKKNDTKLSISIAKKWHSCHFSRHFYTFPGSRRRLRWSSLSLATRDPFVWRMRVLKRAPRYSATFERPHLNGNRPLPCYVNQLPISVMILWCDVVICAFSLSILK